MKILLIIITVAIFSCNNESKPVINYADSIRIYSDSLSKYEQYKDSTGYTENPQTVIARGKFIEFSLLVSYYKLMSEQP